MTSEFKGHTKRRDWFLEGIEQKFLNLVVPWVPGVVRTYHLTVMTLLWSGLAILWGYLSQENPNYLWLLSLTIFLQHLTDMLDGEVGRVRKEGYIKWGFYMDHMFDFLFLGSLILAYSFLLPNSFCWLWIALFTVLGGFMVHFFLQFAITGELRIAHAKMGPSELRYLLIALNSYMTIFGTGYLHYACALLLSASLLSLIILMLKTQRMLAMLDHPPTI